ncbi:MAG: TIR domain-containing protein [Clostridia bacterium]
MILPNFKIFIVYSTKYNDLTNAIIDEINEVYENENIPVEPSYISKDTFEKEGAQIIWNSLTAKINNSDGAIILYTPDIIYDNMAIPRPNVILEMGMLFNRISPNRIWIMCIDNAIPISDIDGIQYHSFKSNDLDGIKNSIKTYLHRYEFAKCFKPLSDDEYKTDLADLARRGYLDNLRNQFMNELAGLESNEKKIVYIAERMKFTSLIRMFSNELREAISNYYIGDTYDSGQIDMSNNIIGAVLRYLTVTQKKRYDEEIEIDLIYEYESIFSDWEIYINWLQGVKKINNLIPMLAYTYSALTAHKLIQLGFSQYGKEKLSNLITKGIEYIKIAENYGKKIDNPGDRLWEGHISFDCARLYELKYMWHLKYKNDSEINETKENCLRYFAEAIRIRKNWYEVIYKKFPDYIAIEFQCEYFYAYLDYLKAMAVLNSRDSEYIISRQKAIMQEFLKWKNKNISTLHDLIGNIEKKVKSINESISNNTEK